MKSLFLASIFHQRFYPKVNRFTYQGFYIQFSLKDMKQLQGTFFGLNRFNLFSFYEKDHGQRDGSSLIDWAKNKLNQAFISECDDIILQTFPRVLGYVFNPVSFWFCYYKEKLVGIICEVNNTFGESHLYLIKSSQASLTKEFHVSPFYPVSGHYDFDFSLEDKAIINYHDQQKLQLTTMITGTNIPWTNKNWLYLFLKFPFYTLTVMFLIHYQAIKLFYKKSIFYKKPLKMNKEMTYELHN